jgi:outer membrane protein assembly factor BamB
MSTRTFAALLALGLIPTPASAGDWPQWRGPDRSNVSAEASLLPAWPDGGPPLLWKIDGLGTGFSPVSVQNGRLYTVANRGVDEFAIALDRGTGKELWATRIGPASKENSSMRQLSQRQPTVDGDRLYAATSTGDLICLETDRGRELWRKNYPAEFSGRATAWGFCDYPLVDGDRLIVTPGGSTATLAALDKRTGEVVWKAAVAEAERADYSPAVIVEVGAVRQYVQSLQGGLAGIAAKDGRLLWRNTKTANRIIHVAAPVVRGDLVFCAGSYGAPSVLLRLVPDGAGTRAEEVYTTGAVPLELWQTGPVLFGNSMYAAGAKRFLCIDWETGRVVWQRDAPGRCPVVCYADNRLYFRCADGSIILAEATPKEFVKRGTIHIPPGPGIYSSWSAPVIAGGRLYVREQGDLYCYDLRLDPPRPAPFGDTPARPRRGKTPDTVFVPTPHDVAEKMLDMAAVKKTDVVYDLGCGDGRIVVAAAQKYGCKAVGIELDAECVKMAREAVRDAKVEELVRIDEGDLFKTDLSGVDVVALYLLPSMNERLIAQLQKMKPGSRIVAHALGIPGIKPDKVVSVVSTEDGMERKVYLYTVPLTKGP